MIDVLLHRHSLLKQFGVIPVVLFKHSLQQQVQSVHPIMQPVLHPGLDREILRLLQILQCDQVRLDLEKPGNQFLPAPEDVQQIIHPTCADALGLPAGEGGQAREHPLLFVEESIHGIDPGLRTSVSAEPWNVRTGILHVTAGQGLFRTRVLNQRRSVAERSQARNLPVPGPCGAMVVTGAETGKPASGHVLDASMRRQTYIDRRE